MKTLFKKDLDKAIDLNVQYFSKPNKEILSKTHEAEEKAFKEDLVWAQSILNALAIKGEKDKTVYYKIFEQLGFKIVKEVKLKLVCYSPMDNILYTASDIKDIEDVWSFVGYIINEHTGAITFKYLCYYSHFSSENFKDWVEKLNRFKDNKNIVGKFIVDNDSNQTYTIKLEEEEL